MSWITRCPVCGVTYKLVPDQLKVAQGWLRCGQCQEAFDSTGLVVACPFEPRNTEHTVVTDVAADRLDIDDLLQQEDRSNSHAPLAAFEEALSSFKPQPLTPTNTAPMPEVFGVPMGALLAPATASEEQTQALPLSATSWWSRALVSMLALTLALQWIWVGRDPLMVAQPALDQVLRDACRLLSCEVVPPPVRDGVVIESSSMTPQEGSLVLVWSVRNVTTQALEMPALELTWLDEQNKVLVRRVLRPSEQAAPPALLAGQIWRGQLHLLPAEGVRPLGYRLVNFYP
jgi:predicted Zn finger-like uncharacterized protein